MEFILIHSLRTLVKDGNLDALELFSLNIVVSSLSLASREYDEVSFLLKSDR